MCPLLPSSTGGLNFSVAMLYVTYPSVHLPHLKDPYFIFGHIYPVRCRTSSPHWNNNLVCGMGLF